MVIANTTEGSTLAFDLSVEAEYSSLLSLISSGRVTALAIHQNGVQHALPLPKKFRRRPQFGAERIFNGTKLPIGERIYAQAEDVRVTLTSSFKTKLVRCDLVKTGHMRYDARRSRS